MSAGTGTPTPKTIRDPDRLAPLFRKQVEAALDECEAAGLEVMIFETYRSPELAAEYFARGRTKKPPERPVTNARTNLQSWHGFGLAIDVVHRTLYWNPPAGWWEKVAEIFKAHGCKWGGDWRQRDLPHFQWGRCKPSPSDRARELFAEGGFERVWQEVGAAA